MSGGQRVTQAPSLLQPFTFEAGSLDFASPTLGLQVCAVTNDIFMWVLGLNFLQGTFFAN